MIIKPLFDRVLIKNIEKNHQTKSGLLIPNSSGDEPLLGKVLAIGNGDCFDGNKTEMAVSVGDKVIYNKYGASTIKDENETFVILRQSDIFAIIEEEE